jgi:hypothetical protein
MTPTYHHRRHLAGLLLAAIAMPTAGAAQYRLPELTSVAAADSLHRAAVALSSTTHRWRDAARMHRRAAAYRVPDDALGFRCLTQAAQLSYAASDRSAAREDMANAAGHALARGDLRAAALAYVDAAWIAQEQHRPGLVRELGHRAEMLAAAPLLPGTDRADVLRRIVRRAGAEPLAVRGKP